VLSFIILGIIQGAVIGLIAIGIVLTYKGAKVFNFAQAEFGSIAVFMLLWFSKGFVLDDLAIVGDWALPLPHIRIWPAMPYPVAFLLALAAVAGIGWLFERWVVRRLFNAPRVTLLVATAGFALLAIAMELKTRGVIVHQVGPLVGGRGVTVFDQVVTPQHLVTLAVFVALLFSLNYFFNKTDLGLAVLATSQEPVATELVGIGTKRMSSFIWTFSAVLGGLAGLLQAPEVPFGAGFMTTGFLLLGFTAAVIGGITSIQGAFVGGMFLGIFSKIVEYLDFTYLEERFEIPGVPELAVFIMLVSVLYARPTGMFGKET
jgi:branched-chain amino acid transport system permease protein